jgi:RNA polymerase sigma factor (sigma-70 family)
MPSPLPNITALLDRINQHDDIACYELYQHYEKTIRSIARRYLKPFRRMQPLCDEDDVSQDAWKSIFRRLRESRIPFEGDAELFAWLVSIARHKAAKAIDTHFGTAKRDPRRRESPKTSAAVKRSVADPAPGPAAIAEKNDLIKLALQSLSDGERLILLMRFDNYSFREIAARLGYHERTVARRLVRLLFDLGELLPWPA